MIYHFISFIGIFFCALFFPLWVFVPVAVLYAIVFPAYELLVLAVCIDAVFGDPALGVWYYYTAVTAGIITISFFSRPYLRLYE